MISEFLAILVGRESECYTLSKFFQEKGVRAVPAPSVRDGFSVVKRNVPDFLVVVDEKFGGNESDVEIARSAAGKGCCVFVIGSDPGAMDKRELVSAGAIKYIKKSSLMQLKEVVEEKVGAKNQGNDGAINKNEIDDILVGRSGEMQEVTEQILKIAPTMAPILVTGESGTGKEKAAEAIHRLSPRRAKPFVAANCGAIPSQLIQSELFGHVKGSFTGAVRDHIGYFEQADGGTLFLDEITEMPVDLQVNLLRVIETGRFYRVGSCMEKQLNFRLVTATNRDPYRAVEEGYLRKDLFYRIQVFQLRMPALRGRSEDIELLANHSLESHNKKSGTRKRFSSEAMRALCNYTWPGNVRELKNVVYRSFILSDNIIRPGDLPRNIFDKAAWDLKTKITTAGTTIAEMEEQLIMNTLNHCGGRREEAARLLGISSKTLYNRLREYREREDVKLVSGG